jgi:hypothetical protein
MDSHTTEFFFKAEKTPGITTYIISIAPRYQKCPNLPFWTKHKGKSQLKVPVLHRLYRFHNKQMIKQNLTIPHTFFRIYFIVMSLFANKYPLTIKKRGIATPETAYKKGLVE